MRCNWKSTSLFSQPHCSYLWKDVSGPASLSHDPCKKMLVIRAAEPRWYGMWCSGWAWYNRRWHRMSACWHQNDQPLCWSSSVSVGHWQCCRNWRSVTYPYPRGSSGFISSLQSLPNSQNAVSRATWRKVLERQCMDGNTGNNWQTSIVANDLGWYQNHVQPLIKECEKDNNGPQHVGGATGNRNDIEKLTAAHSLVQI